MQNVYNAQNKNDCDTMKLDMMQRIKHDVDFQTLMRVYYIFTVFKLMIYPT